MRPRDEERAPGGNREPLETHCGTDSVTGSETEGFDLAHAIAEWRSNHVCQSDTAGLAMTNARIRAWRIVYRRNPEYGEAIA